MTNSRFPVTSRYHQIETTTLETVGGETVAYLRRRFLPDPDDLELLREHRVAEGDRLDRIAARYLGDAELLWRICDAQRALRPEELTETVGRVLRITLPEGVSGPTL